MDLLVVKDLKKYYGKNQILNELSFSVKEAEIFGFLGPNGAGKSTMINILSMILKADSGQVTYKGDSIVKNNNTYRYELGVVPQNLALYENMSALDNIRFFAQFYNLGRKVIKRETENILDMVGLLDRKNDVPSTFSGGMKRRLNLACSLVHHPKLLILDEPTVGVDPQSRNKIMEIIKDLRQQGTSIIYTTHYMEEVENICSRVAIIDKGRIIKEGSLNEIVSKNIEYYTIWGDDFSKLNISKLKSMQGVVNIEVTDCIKIVCESHKNVLNNVLLILMEDGIDIYEIKKEEDSLEKTFLKLTGKNLRD